MAETADRTEPVPTVRVGLVGAGPWAELFPAPLLALSAGTELTGVWARRPEEAERIAAPYGARGSPASTTW